MFFKISDKFIVKSVDFLEETGTLYDLLIYLLDNSKRLFISTETQLDLGKAINMLKIIITNMQTGIKDQGEEQENETIAEQESVLNNVKVLLGKRGKLIDQFANNNIISKIEKKIQKFRNDVNDLVSKIAEKKRLVKAMALKHTIIW